MFFWFRLLLFLLILLPLTSFQPNPTSQDSVSFWHARIQAHLETIKKSESTLPIPDWTENAALHLGTTDTLLDDLYHKIAVGAYNSNQYETAILWYHKELAQLRHQVDFSHTQLANAYTGLVASLLENFQYPEANAVLSTQETDFEAFNITEPHLLGDFRYSQADFALKTGDYANCLDKGHLALQHYEAAPTELVFNREMCRLRMGAAYDFLGKPQSAILQYRDVLLYCENIQYSEGMASALHNIGISQRMLGNLDSSAWYFNRSLELNLTAFSKEKDPYFALEIARTRLELARTYLAAGAYAKAETSAAVGSEFRTTYLTANHPDRMESLLIQGEIAEKLAKNGDFSAAKRYYSKAYQIANATKENSSNLLKPLEALANLDGFELSKDLEKAKTAHQRYVQFDSIAQNMRLKFLAEESKLNFSKELKQTYEKAISNAAALFSQTRSTTYLDAVLHFSTRTKSLTLLDGFRGREALHFAGLPDSILGKERTLAAGISAMTKAKLTANSWSEAQQTALISLFSDQERFFKDLEKNYPKYVALKYATSKTPSIAQIQENLEKNTLLIDYFWGKNAIFSLVIDNKKVDLYQYNQPKMVDSLIELFHKHLEPSDQSDTRTFLTASHSLFQILLDSALQTQKIDPKQPLHLTIFPDASLYRLPFDALVTAPSRTSDADAPFLLKTCAVTWLPSVSFWKKQESNSLWNTLWKKNPSFAAFGLDFSAKKRVQDDDTALELAALPYSITETQEVAALMQGETFLHERATSQQFIQALQHTDYVHVCTHGLHRADDPSKSSLIFESEHADTMYNQLFSNELYSIESKTNMAYLSTCHSGEGEIRSGEGLMGFFRAFSYSGVKTLVMHLWSLPDRASSIIATGFYAHLREGMPKDYALRQAKMDYLDQCHAAFEQAPFFWASATLVGQNHADFSQKKSQVWLISAVAIAIFALIFKFRKPKAQRNA